MLLAMSQDQEREIDSISEIEQGEKIEELDMYAYQDSEEPNQVDMNFSDEDRENFLLAMAESEPEQADFSSGFEIAEMDYNNRISDLSFYDDGHADDNTEIDMDMDGGDD